MTLEIKNSRDCLKTIFDFLPYMCTLRLQQINKRFYVKVVPYALNKKQVQQYERFKFHL